MCEPKFQVGMLRQFVSDFTQSIFIQYRWKTETVMPFFSEVQTYFYIFCVLTEISRKAHFIQICDNLSSVTTL